MSNVPMISPVSLETVKNYAVASGMLIRGLNPYDYTSADEFVTAVHDAPESWLGATSGTTDISEGRKTWTPDHNGLRVAFKGGEFFDTAEPMLKASLVEMTPQNVAMASGAADIVTDEEKRLLTKVVPRATIKDGDYIEPLVWFTNYGTRGVIGVILHNALCINGMSWKIDDKKVATCDVEFRGHADSVVLSDTLPIEYFILNTLDTIPKDDE